MTAVIEGQDGLKPAGAADSALEASASSDTSPASAESSADASTPPGKIAIDGSLTTRYVGRWSGGEHDQDIYSLLSVGLGDPDQDPYTAYILGRVAKDLDGVSGGENSPFFSLEDTYDSSVNVQLYEAYADFHDTGLDLLRVGRQSVIETPAYARFDGVALETSPDGSDKRIYGVYGGQTTHEYESSSEGDSVYGVYVANRMWKGGRTRIDYMHLDDEEQLGSEHNDLWSAQVQQQVGQSLNLKSGYSLLDDSPREFDARATWTPPDSGWLVQANYYQLLQTEGVLAEELDPFTSSLQQYFPYTLSRLLVSRIFEQGYSLEGGADLRRVDDASDQGEFNRDFDRYHLTGTIDDWLMQGLALAVTGEYWTSDGSDANSMGLDLTREVSDTLRASIGSYYQLYKNDFLNDQERDDVRTYYAAMRYRRDKHLTYAFGFEHEINSIDDMNTVTAKATWNF